MWTKGDIVEKCLPFFTLFNFLPLVAAISKCEPIKVVFKQETWILQQCYHDCVWTEWNKNKEGVSFQNIHLIFHAVDLQGHCRCFIAFRTDLLLQKDATSFCDGGEMQKWSTLEPLCCFSKWYPGPDFDSTSCLCNIPGSYIIGWLSLLAPASPPKQGTGKEKNIKKALSLSCSSSAHGVLAKKLSINQHTSYRNSQQHFTVVKGTKRLKKKGHTCKQLLGANEKYFAAKVT